MTNWLSNLNPEQQEAALHNEGPLLILAGAGSGKTTVLVARTGRLISERLTSPERICVLTFTNKAANELKSRVAQRLGEHGAGVWAGTFHGFGLQILKRYWQEAELPKRFGIIDASDAQSIVKDLMRDHVSSEKERVSLDTVMSKISAIRESGRTSGLDESVESALAETLAPKYQRRLRHLGVVDFEELLLRPLKLISENPRVREEVQKRFDFVMVDEFQDTNATQMKLVKKLVESHLNIAVVGDDDQSIYGWRGAQVENILGFPNTFKDCKVVKLVRNYRSTKSILSLANCVIANNQNRHAKALTASNGKEGQKPELFVYENEENEVDQLVYEIQQFRSQGHAWKDIAVLYRSNTQGGLAEGELRRARIPYSLTGGTALFDRREAKDALAFIRCSISPNELSFRRVINLPSRGIGDKTLEEIEATAPELSFFHRSRIWAKKNMEEKASESLRGFLAFLENLQTDLVTSSQTAEQVLTQKMDELGYKSFVYQSYRDKQSAERRWQCVHIVGRILDSMFTKHGRTVDTLDMFVDTMELRDPGEDSDGEAADQVQMMTLHACKGLEFPIVFLLGLEEDLLPHARLGQDIDEERRLFYVGATRAKEHLIMTRVRSRKRYGQLRPVSPSRFLLEIDPKLYEQHEGFRPVSGDERKSMVSDLLKKLEQKIADRSNSPT